MPVADTLPWRTFWLAAASLVAGVMNAVAGGGSFVSFPAMMGMGVAPVQANATNTVALWPGQLTSMAALRGDLRRDLLPIVGLTSIVGGVAGAEVLLHTRQRTFLHLIPWLMLLGTASFAASGRISRWMRSRAQLPHAERMIAPWTLAAAMLPVSVYIGYFGAGSGIMLMSVFALVGLEDLHAANALKVAAAMLANLCATLTFIARGAVVWRFFLIGTLFAALGGWVGAHWARRLRGEVLRAFVVATGVLVSAYFFWKQAHA